MEPCAAPSEEEEEDPFLSFVDYARSVIVSSDAILEGDTEKEETRNPGWSWVASRLLKTCICYASGVTPAILFSELYNGWGEQLRIRAPKRRPEIINHLKKKNKRTKLPKTVTIDSIYEKHFLSLSSVLETVVIDSFLLPGTNIQMLRLGDYWSSNTIDLYLHRRYYHLVEANSSLLAIGREIFLTGCHFRRSNEGNSSHRLLPTEYFVILLDDEEDDDAMLIAAQFCYDAFSSVSLNEPSSSVSYSLYARIESIGLISQEGHNNVEWRPITLVDNDGTRMKFLLWGEQVILANLLSVGSTLAIEKPFIANCGEELCLEYGSATQLYLIPFIKPEEQVSVQKAHTPIQKVSQVKLLCDFHGAVDFSNYPIRSFVADVCDKMTCVSLYGTVAGITRANTSVCAFTLRIEDSTGSTDLTLYFDKKWSLGRVSTNHTIFISGLSTHKKHGSLEVCWFEKDEQSCFVNMSCLAAVQNSTCLHRMTRLNELSTTARFVQVCHVRLDNIERCRIEVRYVHSLCGNAVGEDCECRFCGEHCGSEIKRSFHLAVNISDETGNILGWCVGETASEMLQVSADDFSGFCEDDQIMYFCSLESEEFVVCLVHCKKQEEYSDQLTWEITRARKSDDSQPF